MISLERIVCKIFGHQAPSAHKHELHAPEKDFSTLHFCGEDKVGRGVACVIDACPRCGKEYIVAHVHIPTTTNDIPVDPDDDIESPE